MMPEDVRRAVERDWSNARVNAGLVRAMAQLDPRARNLNHVADDLVGLCNDIDAIRAHLLAREAEVEGMRTLLDLLRTDNNGKKYHCIVSRAGSVVPVEEIIAGTAHLSENRHD